MGASRQKAQATLLLNLVSEIGGLNMSKNIIMLSGLLVLQLVITGILFSTESSIQGNNDIKPLVNLNNSELNKVKIIDGDKELTLTKLVDKWQLEDYPELELQDNKVRSITNELATIQVSWPVTSTPSSHERFKVTDSNFEKQVTFTGNGGNHQTLYLGKTPSYKQLYARNVEQNDVFSIEYSGYQVSADVGDWLDKSQLSVDNISKIKHSVINLEKKEESWQLAPPSSLGEQQALDTSSIEEFVNQLNSLSISDIADGVIEPTNTLTISDDKGNQYVYSFASNEKSYFVQRDDIKQWFTLSKPKYEQLANLSLEQFILKTEKKRGGKNRSFI